MRTLTIFTLLVLLNLSSFAENGKSSRFKINVKLKDNSELTGYIYTDSLRNYFYHSENNNFSDFVKQEIKFPIKVYKEIKTIDFSVSYKKDFTVQENYQEIHLTDLYEIILLEKIEYVDRSRLITLEENEYNLLEKELKLSLTINQSNDSDECLINIFYFGDKIDASEIKNVLMPIIEKFDTILNSEEKAELISKEILIFKFCNE